MGDIGKPVAEWISQNVGWAVLVVVFLFSIFFEFSKIKLSPITTFLRWIGNRITGGLKDDIADLKQDTNQIVGDLKKETNKQIKDLKDENEAKFSELEKQTGAIQQAAVDNYEQLKSKMQELEDLQDSQAAARIKNHVLTFSRRCRNGEKHTEEDFRNLIEEHQQYEKLVQKHNWTNDVYKEDYAFFINEYHRCIRENDFLR